MNAGSGAPRLRQLPFLGAVLLLVLEGCGAPPPSPFAQRAGESFAVSLPAGGPARAASRGPNGFAWPRLLRFEWSMPSAQSKFVAPLGDWVRDSSGQRLVQVVVGYADPVVPPRLPVEDLESGDSLAVLGAQRFASRVVDSLRHLREGFYRRERTRLARDYGARVEETYLVTNSVLTRLSLYDVKRLAARWEVRTLHLAGEETGAPPPESCPDPSTAGDGNPYPCEARHWIGTDPYRDAGLSGGQIALLDTGVDTDHSMFQAGPGDLYGPDVHAFDCWQSASCASTAGRDLHRAFGGHGTKSASLLVGSSAHGSLHAGVTRARLVAYRVYHREPGSDPSQAAFDLQAYLRAMDVLERQPPAVVLAEAQDGGGIGGDAAVAADRLFAGGSMIIAPVGNAADLSPGAVGSPAISARVLAVGARECREYGTTWEGQAFGAAPANRIKPDVQAPSYTLGASTNGPDEFSVHPKTSGAAPYAAGFARIMRNVLRLSAGSGGAKPAIDPGQVYAAMLATGANSGSFPAKEGAGPLTMPASGTIHFGKATLSTTEVRRFDIPLNSALPTRCRVAIWWPDPRPIPLLGGLWWLACHHDMDLEASIGDGPAVRSAHPEGVFETVSLVVRPSAFGQPPLRVSIIASNTGLGSQTVYWAVVMAPP